MPLYIVEGLDRTGKTSLCESQPVTTRSRYLHFSKPSRHPLEEYITPLLDYLPGAGETIWIDRHYLGELVWPKIFGRKTVFDEPMARYVEMFLHSRGAMCLYAARDYFDLLSACRNEPVHGHVTKALVLFEEAMSRSLLPWHTYVHGQSEIQTLIDIELGNRHEELVSPMFKATDDWVGARRPDILLVGEQVNRPETNGWSLPFVPYRNTSGYFLMQELATVPQRTVAICNALKPDGEPERVRDLWESLGRPDIVALGLVATKAMIRAGLPHGSAPHPQYWRRFKRSAGPGSYMQLIEEAV